MTLRTLLFIPVFYSINIAFGQQEFSGLSFNEQQIGSKKMKEPAAKWAQESFALYTQNNEDLTLRDANSKHFLNDNGTITTIIGAGNLHYWEDNRWKTIFHAIDETSIGFENVTNSFKTFFPINSNGVIKTILPSGESITDLIDVRMLFETNGQEENAIQILAKGGSSYNNVLTYEDVFGNGIHLRFTQNTNKRKLDYVIPSISDLGSVPIGAEFLVFEEKIELPSNWTALISGNEIHVLDNSGMLKLVYEEPVYKDAPQLDLDGHYRCDEIQGVYSLSQTGSILTIQTKVPLNWLLASDRDFPVIIDPTVNCLPNVTERWTGHHVTSSSSTSSAEGSVNYTSSNITSSIDNNIRVGRINSSDVFYSWMRFNVSSIPDDACITSASVNYNISYNYSNSPPDCQLATRIRHMSTDPALAFNATNNPNRLTDIRDGDIYQQQNLAVGPTPSGGWVNTPLTANLNNLVSQLPADWFALGFHTYAGGSHTSCYFNAFGYNDANKPFLTVVYRSLGINAGTDQTICPGQVATLQGSVPSSPSNNILFSDDFESYGNVIPLPVTGAGWKSTTITSASWTWQIKNSCTPIGGSRCLSMTDGYGTDCDYSWDDSGNKIAWYGTSLDASMYIDLRLNFKWKAYGEACCDYGKVVYSLDGVNWIDLNATQYNVQSNWQTVSNLNLSLLDGQIFYIGFRWLNDSNTGTAPGFIIDDVSITGTPITLAYLWTGGPIVTGANTLTPSVNPSSSTLYTLSTTLGSCTYNDQVLVNLPIMGNTLSLNNESSSCLVSGNNWIHFYHESGRYIGAIHPQGQNLGWVTMTSYVDVTNGIIPACASPSNPATMTSVMQRHWTMFPDNQPGTDVQVGLPFLNDELISLVSSSTLNSNPNDDVGLISDVLLSKYHGPDNVNNSALDNCFSSGGNENTTIHNQSGNGDLAAVLPGFVNTSYTTYTIPDFSEFWLHGSTNLSPLPVTLSAFNAICDDNQEGVKVQWTTDSEQNTSHFEIQKSHSDSEWITVANIDAAGNSNASIQYQFIDETERAENSVYYRLNQVDNNGNSTLYGPVEIKCFDGSDFEMLPNPANLSLTIILPDDQLSNARTVVIKDLNGKEIIISEQLMESQKSILIDISSLQPGIYLVAVYGQDQIGTIKRLIKL